MSVHNRKIKLIEFGLGDGLDEIEFQCQVQSWTLTNNTDDGEQMYAQCPDGAFREETDPDWALEVTFYADWRSDGISDYLWAHNGETVPFRVDHHPDISAEHVQFTGEVMIKAPNVGGEARATEMTETTLSLVGEPTYTRVP
jgi:hypothetical protein